MAQVGAGPSGSPARRLRGPLAVLAAAGAAVLLVATVDPHESGHYPPCPLLAATGLYCPGCGALRMIHSLAHGDLAAAFGRNPLLFVLLPFLGYLWVRWAVLSARGRPMASLLLRPGVAYVLVGVVVVYWVVRNLPFASALAP
ncbi:MULTISPECIES: DUF2752 domain-containing protein [Thermomonospora]|uniref:Putative transmembrane protein n=1 Tax=Thermomonospora curvata (strain ATCC 19995 / DSM 43183 / JCM 3096 / KCTC 9072 / NBRC 15933 / NCIMB 10081 / Henssen B9) TaxID=471852 RepID=D1A717_THECD|nr:MULTISPECIES: DUF2752 domain-containing protein [Thermomonospora]ACY98421.1 putative transmembrane protein [Thermomonospora curvata DSM 43183]PKK13571.1 MAG: DUF2752 domain-containing protein [Thermomonospora sp. CIF 1]